MRRKSDLPFGSQLSPAQISLAHVLEMLERHGGATPEFTEAVRSHYFGGHAHGDRKQQGEIAKNVRLALHEYGVISDNDKLTALGKQLASARADKASLHNLLARHILLNLKGLDLLRAVTDMKAARVDATLVDIARELERRDIHVPESGTHISSMKGWLVEAGVIDNQWNIDEAKLRDLVGHGPAEIEELSRFGPEQRAFIKALVAMPGTGPFNSAEVARLATSMSHVSYDPKNLRHQVLFPLRDSGYLDVTKSTKGRGAKPYLVTPTPRFNADFIVPVLDALAHAARLPAEIFRRPLDEIVADLTSTHKDTKGRALELLAAYACRILGLHIVGWRLRSKETGGQEVDVIAEGTNYVFLRWEVQCKNTRVVSADDVAREVGVAVGNHAAVVLMLTTGRFTEPARKYAEQILQRTNLNVIMLDAPDLREVVKRPAALGGILGKHAKKVMKLKRLEGMS